MTDCDAPGRYLPHKPPMRMVSRIVSRAERSIHCTGIIDARNPLVTDGRFPAIGGLELVAQAAGVLLGLASAGAPARPGVIVQVKRFSIEPAEVPVGAELHIHARLQAGGADAALVEGEVFLDDRPFFSALVMLALLPGGHP